MKMMRKPLSIPSSSMPSYRQGGHGGLGQGKAGGGTCAIPESHLKEKNAKSARVNVRLPHIKGQTVATGHPRYGGGAPWTRHQSPNATRGTGHNVWARLWYLDPDNGSVEFQQHDNGRG